MCEKAADTSHADQMRELAGIDYDDFANLMEKSDALPTTKFKAVHYWPRSSSSNKEPSSKSERLGSGVKPLEVAEQVKKKVDEIVEITNIWGLYSDQVPEGEPARLNFQGFIYFLGTFRKSRDYFISFEIDVEGSDGEEVYKIDPSSGQKWPRGSYRSFPFRVSSNRGFALPSRVSNTRHPVDALASATSNVRFSSHSVSLPALSDPTIARQLPIDTICALTGVHLTGRAVRRRNPETLRSLQPLGLEVMFAASAAECACLHAAYSKGTANTKDSGSESGHAPPLKFKAIHHWPAPAVYSWPHSEDSDSEGPGFSGVLKHRFRHDYDWTSVCPEDLDTMLDRAIQAFIPDIRQEDYIVRPAICLDNETYIDVEVVNVAFFDDFYRIDLTCNGQFFEQEQAWAQIEPDQVLFVLSKLDRGVNPSEIAERIKVELTDSVEITSIFSIHSEQPTRGNDNHLNFEGSVYALGKFHSDCNSVDLSGIENIGNESHIHWLTRLDF
ncbi:uncharacterized protein PAN0_009c3730 [Moesziomyces antarcticus]|uniref:Uncharacterized protein n=2 Tax=Pseudozyma antarctica TaxID=84753 RepID=A0A081CFR7_PSEA2|nr:uncharacterized protein PAN0_009c3730 [Moesziomyces antarcticus]GAK65513.1 hypothetical protein PAN0_009c3730 [Moesziomyces antarcticus]SPO46522.1 uncharacterized protein PSANT_04208 [Moesziomyces antarcticus]